MKKKPTMERVDIRVVRDYYPPGWAEPLLKKGEVTWIAGAGVERIALDLARAGYVHRIGRQGDSGQTHHDRYHQILARLSDGADQAAVAREFGVTRQYVSYIRKKAQREAPKARGARRKSAAQQGGQ